MFDRFNLCQSSLFNFDSFPFPFKENLDRFAAVYEVENTKDTEDELFHTICMQRIRRPLRYLCIPVFVFPAMLTFQG